jgi:cytochrome c oxidase assembly factor CtaG
MDILNEVLSLYKVFVIGVNILTIYLIVNIIRFKKNKQANKRLQRLVVNYIKIHFFCKLIVFAKKKVYNNVTIDNFKFYIFCRKLVLKIQLI